MALRYHDVHLHCLRIEMARKRGSLLEYSYGGNGGINRQKNSLKIQGHTKALEPKCPSPSSLVVISNLDFQLANIVCFLCPGHPLLGNPVCADDKSLGRGADKIKWVTGDQDEEVVRGGSEDMNVFGFDHLG